MATKEPRRHHRRRHTKPKRASTTELIPPGPTSVHHIPDHLLELVLLRVGSSLALLRAAFTCKRWRRIITADTAFLATFRALHAPHVPGHYHIVDPSHDDLPPNGNNQAFVPDSSTPDVIDRRHFALDFLPDLDWELGDSRGGLLLLYRRPHDAWYRTQPELRFTDIIVCDPLTRRYQGILCWNEMYHALCLGLFLLDGAALDETGSCCISMSNFRVVSVVYETPTPGVWVFTSGSDGGWQESAASSGGVPIPEFHLISFVGRACSSLYWRMEGQGVVLALDETTLDFTLVTFPYTVVGWPGESSTFRVIGGHEVDATELRVVRIVNNGDLTVFAKLQSNTEWVTEKLVRLPEATCGLPGYEETYFQRPAKIVAATTRYILLKPREDENWIVSVNLVTLEVERAHERNNYAGAAYAYELPWPPALQACRADSGQRRRRINMLLT
ncbi:hypothetical protein QYE76_007697 [Lolium multiflorum]|uniref:F-box domain-containing protein n=1 Tax=Lolium multiflorum TaxID=4521 RepID=A0AAD8QHV3_LOLMU|nr:hypothetical protein QYE76_007697 [Lolium multiflorum]